MKIEIFGDWLKTQAGDYVNLKKVAFFTKYYNSEKWFVQAIYPSTVGIDHFSLLNNVGEFDTEEQAQKYMDTLMEEISYDY